MGSLGLDVSQQEVVACRLLPDGREAVPRWRVPDTPAGAETLADRVALLAEQHGLRRLRLGLEATNRSWWPLAGLLKDTPRRAGLERAVDTLNPKLVHGLKRAYSDTGKTDRQDACFIAERLRLGRLPAPFQVDVRSAPLQWLPRFRAHLAQTLAREKNSFLTFLFLKFSAFGQQDLFGDPFGATSLAVLETCSTEEPAQTSLEQLAAFILQHGRGRCAAPEAVAAALRRAARASYRLDRVLDEPLTQLLGTTMATIRTLQGQVREVDQAVARELAALPPDRRMLETVPGLGLVWTAGLVAEIGDIHRFANAAALAQFAGLVWHPRQSGTFQADDTALAQSGNASLRSSLVEAANRVRLPCAEYRDDYAAKLAHAPTHAHKRALVLTAHTLGCLVDVLLRTGAAYRSAAARQDRGEERPRPHPARPRPQRRSRLVRSAS